MLESISLLSLWKIIVAVIVATFIGILVYSQDMHSEVLEDSEHKHYDPVIGSIVIGGVLFFYIVFLSFQADKLFIGGFPNSFTVVEQIVK